MYNLLVTSGENMVNDPARENRGQKEVLHEALAHYGHLR